MEQMEILTYDGSFKGFLTAAAAAISENHRISDIEPAKPGQPGTLFGRRTYIPTETERAWQLWEHLGSTDGDTQRYVYYAFLSERLDIQWHMYRYIDLLLKGRDTDPAECFRLKEILSPWAQRVGREKRHAEASIMFRTAANGLQISYISPVFNILPLLSKFCRNRFRERSWMVVDQKRNQMLFNDSGRVVLSGHAGDARGGSASDGPNSCPTGEALRPAGQDGLYPMPAGGSPAVVLRGQGFREPAGLERRAG